jgi:hypothetical protein
MHFVYLILRAIYGTHYADPALLSHVIILINALRYATLEPQYNSPRLMDNFTLDFLYSFHIELLNSHINDLFSLRLEFSYTHDTFSKQCFISLSLYLCELNSTDFHKTLNAFQQLSTSRAISSNNLPCISYVQLYIE